MNVGLTGAVSWRHRTAPALAAGFVVIWACWAVLFNHGQFGDNIEQFNWAHSLEWGYHKHPPMPTWLLGSAVRLFGPSVHAAIVLAALCFTLTGWLTWDIARQLLGRRAATAVVLLWGLQQCFSTRAQLYNHNTVLVLFIAAAAWAALRARDGNGWWVLTGLFGGAAMLSKYQAVVPLFGVMVALAASGRLKSPRRKVGLAVAVVTTLAVFAPHVFWVVDHDFSTLRYAGQSVGPAGFSGRMTVLVQFIVNQLRMLLPALLAMACCALWVRLARPVKHREEALASAAVTSQASAAQSGPIEAWLFGLVALPLVILGIMDLIGGVSLRNHWGVQTTQFITLWMVHRWRVILIPNVRKLACLALAMQAIGLAVYVGQHRDAGAYEERRRMDSAYPGQLLADAAMANWRHVTACPAKYVYGDSFPAGLISLYSGGLAAVFEGRHESPWIDMPDMERSGAIIVIEPDDTLPGGAVSPVTFLLPSRTGSDRTPRRLILAVVPPAVECAAGG